MLAMKDPPTQLAFGPVTRYEAQLLDFWACVHVSDKKRLGTAQSTYAIILSLLKL